MKNATKIEHIIKEISKAYITIDTITKDFLINGNIPQELPQDLYLSLYRDFEHCIKLQLKENCSIDLLKEFVTQTDSGIESLDNIISHLRVNYILAKSKGKISENAANTNDYIGKMLKIKSKALLKIHEFLDNEIKYFGNDTSEDYKTFEDSKEPESDILISEKTERATFNLGKKESLVLLFTMEKIGLLKFNNDAHRKQFIENNFNYTELRDNDNIGKSMPIQNISPDLSKLKSSHKSELIPNNKTLEELKDMLTNSFFEYKFK
jgi:hypothetical protein